MLFSVVIPLYNKVDTIERTLRAVEAQVFRDFEVVVVDDGSADDSAAVVAQIERTFPLRILTQVNAGVSVARNRGVAESYGKYIAFLDADDVWHKEYLQELAKIIELNPDAEFVGCSSEIVYADYVMRMKETGKIEKIFFYDEWPFYSAIHTSSFAVSKTAFDRVGGFTPGCKFYEDAELYYKLAKHYPLYVSRRNLEYYYRDAEVKACSTSSKTCLDWPHWKWAESELANGSRDKALKRCIRIELLRQLNNYARSGNVEMIGKIVGSYPNLTTLLPVGFFESKLTRTLGLPILLAIAAWFRMKHNMRVKVEAK